jgi:basic membrane protein A
VFDIIRDVSRGEFRGGVRELGLAQDGVGFVYDEHNRDRIAASTVERVRAIASQIIEGEIEVPSR